MKHRKSLLTITALVSQLMLAISMNLSEVEAAGSPLCPSDGSIGSISPDDEDKPRGGGLSMEDMVSLGLTELDLEQTSDEAVREAQKALSEATIEAKGVGFKPNDQESIEKFVEVQNKRIVALNKLAMALNPTIPVSHLDLKPLKRITDFMQISPDESSTSSGQRSDGCPPIFHETNPNGSSEYKRYMKICDECYIHDSFIETAKYILDESGKTIGWMTWFEYDYYDDALPLTDKDGICHTFHELIQSEIDVHYNATSIYTCNTKEVPGPSFNNFIQYAWRRDACLLGDGTYHEMPTQTFRRSDLLVYFYRRDFEPNGESYHEHDDSYKTNCVKKGPLYEGDDPLRDRYQQPQGVFTPASCVQRVEDPERYVWLNRDPNPCQVSKLPRTEVEESK